MSEMVEDPGVQRGIVDAAVGYVDTRIADMPETGTQIQHKMSGHPERASEKQGTGKYRAGGLTMGLFLQKMGSTGNPSINGGTAIS